MQELNLSGLQFGRLIAVSCLHKNDDFYWNCSCLCGKTKTVKERNLIYGNSKSCGCLVGICNPKTDNNLTGLSFGYLTPIQSSRKNGRGIIWTCNCLCGNVVDIRECRLLSSIPAKSCGCLQRSNQFKKIYKEDDICPIENCNRGVKMGGFCKKHYERKRIFGDPNRIGYRLEEPLEIKLNTYKEIDENGCWNWTKLKLYGYGKINIDGIIKFVHRVAYEFYKNDKLKKG